MAGSTVEGVKATSTIGGRLHPLEPSRRRIDARVRAASFAVLKSASVGLVQNAGADGADFVVQAEDAEGQGEDDGDADGFDDLHGAA